MATCSPQSLLADSSQFAALPPGAIFPVKLALLVRILQDRNPSYVLNVQALIESASCFLCVPMGVIRLLKLQLLCQMLADDGGGGVEPDPIVTPCANKIPQNVFVFAVDSNEVTLHWNSAVSATSTTVYWSTSPGVTPANAEGAACFGVPPDGPQQCDVGSLTPDTTYYLVVVDDSNPECISNEVSATTTL